MSTDRATDIEETVESSDECAELSQEVLERLWCMIPDEARPETKLLSTAGYSSSRMSDSGFLFEDTHGRIRRRSAHAGRKLIYFLTQKEEFGPDMSQYYAEAGKRRGKRRESGENEDTEDDESKRLSPPLRRMRPVFGSFINDEPAFREDEIPYGISFSEKELEVAEFMRLFETRMQLTTTREEIAKEFEEFLRVTHLPLEVAIYFYEKTKHKDYHEDIFLDVVRLRHEVDNEAKEEEEGVAVIESGFCYEVAKDFYHESLSRIFDYMRGERRIMHDILPASVMNSFLLEGAAEALRMYKTKQASQPLHTEHGPLLFYGKAYDRDSPHESRADYFEELEAGLNFLILMDPEFRADTFDMKRMRLMTSYREIYKEIAISPLAHSRYAVPYVALCHETFDRKGLEEFLDFSLGWITQHIARVELKKVYEQCMKGRTQGLFEDDDWTDGDLELVKVTLMAWNALKSVDERKGEKGKHDYSRFEPVVEKLRKCVVDDIIKGYILKDLGNSFQPTAELKNYDYMLTLSPLLAVLGEPELDYEIFRKIAEHAGKSPLTAEMYASTFLNRYFTLPNKHGTGSDDRKYAYGVLYALTSPKKRLTKEQLSYWQDKFAGLFMDLNEQDMKGGIRSLAAAERNGKKRRRQEENEFIRFYLGDGKSDRQEKEVNLYELSTIFSSDEVGEVGSLDEAAQQIIRERRLKGDMMRGYEKLLHGTIASRQLLQAYRRERRSREKKEVACVKLKAARNRLTLEQDGTSVTYASCREWGFHGRWFIQNTRAKVYIPVECGIKKGVLYVPKNNGTIDGIIVNAERCQTREEHIRNRIIEAKYVRDVLFTKTKNAGITIFDDDMISVSASGIYLYEIKAEKTIDSIWGGSFLGDYVHYRERQETYAKEKLERYDLLGALDHLGVIGQEVDYIGIAQSWLDDLSGQKRKPMTRRKILNLIKSCAGILGIGEGKRASEIIEYETKAGHEAMPVGDALKAMELKDGLRIRLKDYIDDKKKKGKEIDSEIFKCIMGYASRFYEAAVLEEGAEYLLSRDQPLFPWLRDYWPDFGRLTLRPENEGAYRIKEENIADRLMEEASAFLDDEKYTEAHTIYRRLNPAFGNEVFLKEVYRRKFRQVRVKESRATEKEGFKTPQTSKDTSKDIELLFRGKDDQETIITFHTEELYGYGSLGVSKQSIAVNCNGKEGKGRRVIVAKVNEEERLTQIEFKVYDRLRGNGAICVAKPLVVNGREIVVEYSGQTLVEYAQRPDMNLAAYTEYLAQAIFQKVWINKSLEGILDDTDKAYLEDRRIRKVFDYFEGICPGRYPREDVARDYHALRVMRAFGFHDTAFGEAYMRTIGRALSAIPEKYRSWVKDNYGHNFVVSEDDDGSSRVVVIDFNNIYHDALQLDDSIFIHTYGLRLTEEGEKAMLETCMKKLGLEEHEFGNVKDPRCEYKRGFIPASVHRNLLMAGNIIRAIEAGRAPKEKYAEVEHHMGIAMRYITEFQRVFGTEFAGHYQDNRKYQDKGNEQDRGNEGFKEDLIHVITKANLWCQLHFGCQKGELDKNALFGDMQRQRIITTDKYQHMSFSE